MRSKVFNQEQNRNIGGREKFLKLGIRPNSISFFFANIIIGLISMIFFANIVHL
jgi:hypothetical protein